MDWVLFEHSPWSTQSLEVPQAIAGSQWLRFNPGRRTARHSSAQPKFRLFPATTSYSGLRFFSFVSLKLSVRPRICVSAMATMLEFASSYANFRVV